VSKIDAAPQKQNALIEQYGFLTETLRHASGVTMYTLGIEGGPLDGQAVTVEADE
jgi:hypothetical protein